MKNIFLHEWKMLRKSTWGWTITLCALAFFFFSLYPAFSRDAEITRKLLEAFPEVIRELIGISLTTFFSPTGFYAFVFAYVMLLGSIQAMNYGLLLLSKESRDKTIDFLLSKPITRNQILTAKLLAGLCALLLTNVIYYLFSSILVVLVARDANQTLDYLSLTLVSLTLLNFTLFFVQCIFYSLGLLLSVLIPKIKSVVTITLTTVFSFFILDMFNGVVKDAKLRYILPFKYFDPMYILSHRAYEQVYLMITIVFVFVAITITVYRYQKKDFLV